MEEITLLKQTDIDQTKLIGKFGSSERNFKKKKLRKTNFSFESL